MTLARKTQIGVLITAVVLFVLLFIAPKTHSGDKEAQMSESKPAEAEASIETFITMATKSLSTEEKSKYDALLATAKASKIDTAFVPVVEFWDKQKRPDFAAYFVEQDRKSVV